MKYYIPISLFLIFVGTLYPKNNLRLKPEQLLVWNVGQGQMVTYLSKTHCHHFDMGGEKFPREKLFSVCKNKKNDVRYTHWDFDHTNFSLKTKQILPSLCRIKSSNPLPSKKHFVKKIPLCKYETTSSIQHIHWPSHIQPKNSNESSRIFVVKNQVLIPGDSTKRMEAYWSPRIQDPIQILVTGHHGSRTSTSSFLLNHLPELKLAISSSRNNRYGHPHLETVQKLRKRKILFISTEHFGHIRVPLDNSRPQALPF